MRTVLVAGGAGYVGSHTLPGPGGGRLHGPWSSTTCPTAIASSCSGGRWKSATSATPRGWTRCSPHKPVAVLHFAARIEVGESVKNPGAFFDNNVGGTITLIEAARRAGVEALVFSSTCATFGDPVMLPMDETHPQAPLNPYGRSKLMVEQILADYGRYVGFRSAVPCATSTPPAPIPRAASASGTSPRPTPSRWPSRRPGSALALHDLRRRLRHPRRHGGARLRPRAGPGRRPRWRCAGCSTAGQRESTTSAPARHDRARAGRRRRAGGGQAAARADGGAPSGRRPDPGRRQRQGARAAERAWNWPRAI
jgi:hypothetical protein